MMEPVIRVDGANTNPTEGIVCYDWPKLTWNFSIIIGAVIFAPLTYSHGALALFLGLTYGSLLIGHSVGMHRMMIHRTFECPKPMERLLIYIGVLVGMSGPFGIIKIHDTRDWAQREPACHDFFSHKKSLLKDLWWQLTSKFVFTQPIQINIEEKISNDRFYKFLESTWRLHQLALALLLYFIGGWSFVVWGILVRVSVSIVGHWTITYFCHNPGAGRWIVKNCAVQAANLPGLGILTYGECWHNNHHAFPESARIGLEKGQSDPAWNFIQWLRAINLAKNIGEPRIHSQRDDLIEIE